MSDPYSELYKMMGEATVVESPFLLGKVKSPLPNLEIETSNIILKKNNLHINKWLVDRNEQLKTEDQGHSHGGDTTGDGSHNHDIKVPIHDKLLKDDIVLLARVNSMFIVICKVVKV